MSIKRTELADWHYLIDRNKYYREWYPWASGNNQDHSGPLEHHQYSSYLHAEGNSVPPPTKSHDRFKFFFGMIKLSLYSISLPSKMAWTLSIPRFARIWRNSALKWQDYGNSITPESSAYFFAKLRITKFSIEAEKWDIKSTSYYFSYGTRSRFFSERML